jgi:hypothetical protein
LKAVERGASFVNASLQHDVRQQHGGRAISIFRLCLLAVATGGTKTFTQKTYSFHVGGYLQQCIKHLSVKYDYCLLGCHDM